jgi:hypothetical protein
MEQLLESQIETLSLISTKSEGVISLNEFRYNPALK